MRRFVQKHKWLLAGVALAAILALCAWIFGWFQGTIDVMEFSADEVESIGLYQHWLGESGAVVTGKEDIQAFIDTVNGFRHTGSGIKDVFRYGIGVGGTVLYECKVSFADGEIMYICFGDNGSRQKLSDMEMGYWISRPGQPREKTLFGETCRGSMELFYALYEKYGTENPM